MATASATGAVRRVAKTRTPPPQADANKLRQERQRRYGLQRTARKVLGSLRRRNRKGELVPYRISACGLAASGQGMVRVRLTSQGASYAGLQHCDSVWHCPVCAAAITNHRRKEVHTGVERAQAMGFKPVLLTYTAQHSARTDLAVQLEAMTDAYEAVWRGAPAKRLEERFGVLGTIRTLESTWSEGNGHHPHMHAVVLVRADANVGEFGEAVRTRWETMAERRGLKMNLHGFNVTDCEREVARYLAKWGHEKHWRESDELTRGHTKKGRRTYAGELEHPRRRRSQHCTPWQLLEFAAEGDETAAGAFRDYAVAYHGRRQLCWSLGLREKLGLGEELSDEEVVEAAEVEAVEAVEICTVPLEHKQWKVVRAAAGRKDGRAQLLDVVELSEGRVGIIRRLVLKLFGFVPQVVFIDRLDC